MGSCPCSAACSVWCNALVRRGPKRWPCLPAGPTVALRGIKTLANLSARHGVNGADAQQVDTNNRMWASKDQKRGLSAFLATGPGTAVFEGN